MREFSNHAVLSMSDSTMAVSSKYTQDLSVQIIFFTFSSKWFLCFYFWAVIWSYIVDLFAALHELASATARTLLKLASSVRAPLKPYGDTLNVPTSVWPSGGLRLVTDKTTKKKKKKKKKPKAEQETAQPTAARFKNNKKDRRS